MIRPRPRLRPGREQLHRDAPDTTVVQLDLADVQPGPNRQADAGQLVPERGRGGSPGQAIEGRQDAVPVVGLASVVPAVGRVGVVVAPPTSRATTPTAATPAAT